MRTSVPDLGLPGPPGGQHSRRRLRERLSRPALLAAAIGLVTLHSLDGPTALLSPLAAAPAAAAPPAAPTQAAGESRCEELVSEQLKAAQQRIGRWEKIATEGRVIYNFGGQASRLVNRTLATFDNSVKEQMGDDGLCTAERQVLERAMKQQLHSIFLVQRSSIEQGLYQRLKQDLLKRMRRKRGELDVKVKVRLLHAALNKYDMQVQSLMPFFIENTERDRAEKRLSELQWGITDTPEAQEMKQKWKMDRLRRMPMRQSKGFSVSFSPGLRLMLRPAGFGNLQVFSRRQVGPPHNPNEVSVAVFNDGNVMDVYNKKPQPPLFKFQPTIGIDLSAG